MSASYRATTIARHLVSGVATSDIAVIGLAVMGENLILNMASKGFTVSCWNRTVQKVDQFTSGRAAGKAIIGCHTLKKLVSLLKTPRKIMIMVRAGDAVDDAIRQLLPFLQPNDIIIDGGNSNYVDTNRRIAELKSRGIMFLGVGVSGGEEGALNGPSIMPGGSSEAWEHVKPILQKISAHVIDNGILSPCCDYVGEGGSGHFVKMIHNGIEYGDMQLLAEAYHLLKSYLHLSNDDISRVFTSWNKGDMDSYLVEITSHIFAKKNEQGQYVIDLIVDSAGQKGTGRWTVENALELGSPVTLVAEAVFARVLSAQKDLRIRTGAIYGNINSERTRVQPHDVERFISDLHDALYASKIVSYAQGFHLLRQAASHFKWNLNYSAIALMWRGGCIIRSKFLSSISDAYRKNSNLEHLFLDEFFKNKIEATHRGWRRVVSVAVENGFAVPAISTALSYFDGLKTEHSSAGLIQAQRDYFGAHTYERVDKPRGTYYHTNWTGHGGDTSSSAYNA